MTQQRDPVSERQSLLQKTHDISDDKSIIQHFENSRQHYDNLQHDVDFCMTHYSQLRSQHFYGIIYNYNHDEFHLVSATFSSNVIPD